MVHLLRWHVIDAPLWLVTLAANIQRMLFRYFSVALLTKTLFAHWRRDVVSYAQLSLDKVLMVFAWNSISRVIGFIIRLITLSVYVVSAGVAAGVSVVVITAFVVWPVAPIIAILIAPAIIR